MFWCKEALFGINRQKWISSSNTDIVVEHKLDNSYDDDDTHSHSRSHDSANDNNALDEWVRETNKTDHETKKMMDIIMVKDLEKVLMKVNPVPVMVIH